MSDKEKDKPWIQNLDYSFPLREDITVLIRNLPRDLTPTEADRICVFVKTLAIEGTKP